jgi:phospholipid/cholesterol/gamma-HCH transport system substrate-binding protein
MGFLATPEFKVGLLVLIVSGIIAGMSLTVSNDPSYLGSSKEAWFYIDDASGLVKKSNVRMAGIDVGIIRDIKLENGQAKVEMILQGSVPVTKSARIEIRPNGILGDKHVEIVSGDPRDPPLRSGEQILVVDDRASVDRLISEVSKITKSVSAVAENIKAATEGDVDKPLGRIINNIEQITADVAQLTKEHKDDVGEILANLRETTDSINEVMSDQSDEGFKSGWKDLRGSLRRVEASMKNIEEITAKINRGEGTIGKLVNDESTVEELNTAITGINNLLDTGNKLSTAIDYHTDYLTNSAQAKSFLSVRIQPGLDRYYELGVVDDPRGVSDRTVTKTTDNSGSTTTQSQDIHYLNRVKFNALFAKNFYDFTVRGGIMENSGGVGFDYHMLKHRLRASFEAFDFSNIYLRASLRYSIFNGIYVSGGGDDLASKTGRAGAFVGAGIFLTNDDLKLLLTKMPGL